MGIPSGLLNRPSRRAFLAGTGALGAAALAGCGGGSQAPIDTNGGGTTTVTDSDVLNFALNLEYLEAEFYLRATTGAGLSDADAGSGAGTVTVASSTVVPFDTGNTIIHQYANEIAQNELAHVRLLRSALGSSAVARPAINFTDAFTAAAMAAGVITTGQTFNPFADQTSFLLGAFLFEDVGVTAYTGAATLIKDKNYLSAAAGIQAVEAYHAASIRTILANQGGDALATAAKISALRGMLGGGNETVVTVGSATMASTLVAADSSSLAFGRSTDQVLHIVYATGGAAGVKSGGFFPSGLNGNISATIA